MNDGSFASLSPTLLARKGGARPAMRPQHGGMLGSIGSASNTIDSSSEEQMDDLGWNDMGDEDAAHHDAEVINLTPSPVNAETAAEARQMDERAGAKLAEFTVSNNPISIGHARDQQDVLAKRIETKSPPVLSDAIMSDETEEQRVEDDHGLHDSENLPNITAVKRPRTVKTHRVAATAQGKRAAFTLRLDAERHLKLRLASAIGGRSAQQIVTAALDAFLGDMPEIATLAAQVQRPATDNE